MSLALLRRHRRHRARPRPVVRPRRGRRCAESAHPSPSRKSAAVCPYWGHCRSRVPPDTESKEFRARVGPTQCVVLRPVDAMPTAQPRRSRPRQAGPLAPDTRPFPRPKRASRENSLGCVADVRAPALLTTPRRANPCHRAKSWARSFRNPLQGSCHARPFFIKFSSNPSRVFGASEQYKSENCNLAAIACGNRRRSCSCRR